jgi:hypothetical protein
MTGFLAKAGISGWKTRFMRRDLLMGPQGMIMETGLSCNPDRSQKNTFFEQ